MVKRRKMTVEDVSHPFDKSADECKEKNSSSGPNQHCLREM